jgi:serine/threonine protein kinase
MSNPRQCRYCDQSLAGCPAVPGIIVRCESCRKLNIFLTPDESGCLRFVEYEVLQEVGQGANAVVCKARKDSDDKVYAIKIFYNEQHTADAHAQKEFKREIEFSVDVVHENIVGTYGGSEIADNQYLELEFIDGINLAQYLDFYGAMDPMDAFSVATHVALALDYVWSQFLTIHRDVKPQNVMVDKAGFVKVLDFGLVTTHERSAVDTSAVEGTPFYLSPESVTHNAYQDNRSDIYSLGCTVYHLIMNEPPFDFDELLDVVNARVEEPPPDIRKLKSGISDDVAEVLLTMMAREPEDRYVTAYECLQDLKRVINGIKPLLVDPERLKSNA